MESIVLAGGLGTRLVSRVNNLPKAMAPIADRPFLEIVLRQLERAGCGRVILAVGYLHTVIEEHFGGSFGGMRLDYAVEAAPMGTGGAIRNALTMAVQDSVLVLNGDTFLDADYPAMLRFHEAEGAPMTMAVSRQDDIARYGGVVLRGKRIVGFVEKGHSGPGRINAGAYVLRRDLSWPASVGARFSFESDFLMPEIRGLAPAAFPVDGFFLDIGVPEDFDRAQKELSNI